MMERKAKLQKELMMMDNAIRVSPDRLKRKEGIEVSLPPPPEHKQFIERMMKARRAAEQRRKMNLEYD